jgi:serine protease
MIHENAVTPNRAPAVIFSALALGLALGLAGCDALTPTAVAPDAAPQLAAQAAGAVIPGRFIVTVRDGIDPGAVAGDHGVSPAYLYTRAINGFAGEIRDAARSGLLADGRVLRVEPDRLAFGDGTQTPAPWHLDRVDQRTLPMDGNYQYDRTGAGVTVYVIDSGIRITHHEFGTRASYGYDFVWNDPQESSAEKGDAEHEDCRDHGTSVAALVGGNTAGVAKDVSLVSVRVLGCSGSSPWSRIIAGVEWVTAHHVKPAVSNMSLGGGTSESMDDAVRGSIGAGVTYTVSAGNSGDDRPPRLQLACNRSPARVREALTTAATDQFDRRPSWSSYGECVDLFGPGEGITTASKSSDDGWRTGRSGTSFAAPLVAGVAALYLQEEPTALPARVFAAVIDATTKNIVTNAGSGTSSNHLLFSLAWGDEVEPPPPPPPPPTGPTAAFDVRCDGLACTFTDASTAGDSQISAWSWNFGDANASTDPSPTHTYAVNGTYTVRLTVTDGNGLTDTAEKDVTVSAAGPGPDPVEPSIHRFDLTNTSNPQFARVLVTWEVSGVDLQTVTVVVEGQDKSDTRTWTVSGTSAAGEHEFSFRQGHGTYDVTLTVTAGGVAPVSEVKTIVLSR